MVGTHDTESPSINNGSLKTRKISPPQLTLTAVDRTGIETLLWRAEAHEVLYCR